MALMHAHTGLAERSFDGVIFDMDQTLVDSLPSITRSWTAWAAHYQVSSERLCQMFGIPADEIIAEILPAHLQAEGLERIVGIERNDVGDVVPLPGAADALAALPMSRTAVATSAVAEILRARLNASGLPLPDVLVTRDMVDRGKPAPDIFLKAASLLGFEPSRCLVVEDSAPGVAAAKAAGMPSLGVLTTTSADDLPADTVVDNLSDVRWDVADQGIRVLVAG